VRQRALLPAAGLVLALLPGCLGPRPGSLEVLDSRQAYGRSVAIVGDLHGGNEAIARQLAAELRDALAGSGITVVEDPARADLVVVPTLGRLRAQADGNRAAPRPWRVGPAAGQATGRSVAPEDAVARRAIPSAAAPVATQRAGLLLTAFPSRDYADYGSSRRSLPPVWRIYVAQPAGEMKWNTVASPLIRAAAAAAQPLAKSGASANPEQDP
jgi:hypothetical protein